MSLDKIRERIRRCLAVGENAASSPTEIEQAMRIATHLMHQHNLERADVLEQSSASKRVSYGRYTTLGTGSKRISWESSLAWFISEFVPGVGSYNDNDGEFIRHTFYGPDEEAKWASELFSELRMTTASAAVLKWGGCTRGDGAAYAEGFVRGLIDAHVKEQASLTQGDETTRALTVKSNAISTVVKKGATDWLAKTHGIRLYSSRGMRGARSGSSEARKQGYNDGKNQEIGGRKQEVAKLS